MKDVIIDGVRYVPAHSELDRIGFWYMHDNHTFTRLSGTTLDEILKSADELEAQSSYGMLCPVHLSAGGREIRRVGPSAHSRGGNDPKDVWNAGKAAWRIAIESDADAMRLLPFNAVDKPPQVGLGRPVMPLKIMLAIA